MGNTIEMPSSIFERDGSQNVKEKVSIFKTSLLNDAVEIIFCN